MKLPMPWKSLLWVMALPHLLGIPLQSPLLVILTMTALLLALLVKLLMKSAQKAAIRLFPIHSTTQRALRLPLLMVLLVLLHLPLPNFSRKDLILWTL